MLSVYLRKKKEKERRGWGMEPISWWSQEFRAYPSFLGCTASWIKHAWLSIFTVWYEGMDISLISFGNLIGIQDQKNDAYKKWPLLLYAMLRQFTRGVGGGKAVWSWNRTGKQTLLVFRHRKPSERVCAQHISVRWWAVEIGKESFWLKIAVGSEKWSIVQKTCCWVGNRSTTHMHTHTNTYTGLLFWHTNALALKPLGDPVHWICLAC